MDEQTKQVLPKDFLRETAKKLSRRPFRGVMFPLVKLNNFRKNPKLSDYQYSVSAPMFFALAVLNKLLDEIRIDGQRVTMQVEAAMVELQNQIGRYNKHQEDCKKDKTLRPTLYVNPRVKKGPKTIGAGIDLIFKTEDGKPIILPKDLLKENLNPDGKWLTNEEQERIKGTYFRRFSDNPAWCANIEENLRLNAHPKETERELRKKIKEEIEADDAKMFLSSHGELTEVGKKDPDARKAVRNKDILVQILSCLPMLTCTNDAYYTAQLCRFVGGMDILKGMPLLFEKKFKKQIAMRTANLSKEIMDMVNTVVNSSKVFYKRELMSPGERIDFWNKPSKDEPEELVDYKFLIGRIKEIQEKYEIQEKQYKNREILLDCCRKILSKSKFKFKVKTPRMCNTNETRLAYRQTLGISNNDKVKLSVVAVLYLNEILCLPDEQKDLFKDLMLVAYGATKNDIFAKCYKAIHEK